MKGLLSSGGRGGGSNVVPFGPLRNGMPSAYNFSRFLRTVSEVEAERGLITAMTDALRGDLLAELPGFGEHLGYDGKALATDGRRDDVNFSW